MTDRKPVIGKDVEIPDISRRANEALEAINKAIPDGLMLLSQDQIKKVPSISTGCLSLDRILGVGGLPMGRIVELYGPESGGKTTLCLHVIAEAQKKGGLCVFIDAEHALDPTYARQLGVEVENLLVSQPDYGEQALEIADMLCSNLKEGDAIVIDSVAALVPKAEVEGTMEDQSYALQARLMSKAMRKLSGRFSKAMVLGLFVNQMREKVGVTWGSNEETPGGRALKFYASIRLDIRRIGTIKQGEVSIGSRTRLKVAKNKLAPPYRQVEFDIKYGEGIDKVADFFDIAVNLGLINKAGSWYNFGEEKLGQGRENILSFLKDDEKGKKILGQIEEKIREDL